MTEEGSGEAIAGEAELRLGVQPLKVKEWVDENNGKDDHSNYQNKLQQPLDNSPNQENQKDRQSNFKNCRQFLKRSKDGFRIHNVLNSEQAPALYNEVFNVILCCPPIPERLLKA